MGEGENSRRIWGNWEREREREREREMLTEVDKKKVKFKCFMIIAPSPYMA